VSFPSDPVSRAARNFLTTSGVSRSHENDCRVPSRRRCRNAVAWPVALRRPAAHRGLAECTTRSSAWNAHTDASRFARWHDRDGNNSYTDDRTTRVNAADDLLTTVADYARFGVAVMNGDGLSKAVFDEMLKPQATMKQGAQMTLGWELQQNLNDAGEVALIHSGSDEGVQALVMLLPKSKQGLVVMTNGDNGWKLYEKIVTESLDAGATLMKRAQ
jgi:CubicO group peptidase (beta-lactamase class C family)